MITFTFSGETLAEIKRQVVAVFGPVDDLPAADAPSAPPPAEAPIDREAMKAAAMERLQKVYANPEKRDAVKAVAAKFGVKRFVDVPLERAQELYDAAEAL